MSDDFLEKNREKDEGNLERTCEDCFYFSEWIEDGEQIEFCKYYEKDISHRDKQVCDLFFIKGGVESE